MGFIFSFSHKFGAAGLVVEAILLSVLGILALITFIVLRRWYRSRYFQRLAECTYFWRSRWEQIVSGKLPADNWRKSRMYREVLEAMLLDGIEGDPRQDLPGLLKCLRSSGLLDRIIRDARSEGGWKRRSALVALGRTRAPEALAALTEALDSESQETRIAAVRGFERWGLCEGASPLLDRIASNRLSVPEHTVKNALVSCCRKDPDILVDYLQHATGTSRELLARVLAEVVTPDLEDELLILSADPLAEVRASAARALATAQPMKALPILSDLANDTEWFVRLRAVIALGSLGSALRIRPLVRALADPISSVRKRAAWALSAIAPALDVALSRIVEGEDTHVAEQLVARLQSTGTTELIIRILEDSKNGSRVGDAVAEALSSALASESRNNGAAASAGVG